jgi:hypothetical protein
MYSRKFGLRLHGKFGNLLKTRGLRGCHGLGNGFGDMRNWDEIEVLRERKFVSASSRNQQAGSLRSPRAVNSRKLSESPAAAVAERSSFLGDELSTGSLDCGNDLVEALITAQRIPARKAEIAVCWA